MHYIPTDKIKSLSHSHSTNFESQKSILTSFIVSLNMVTDIKFTVGIVHEHATLQLSCFWCSHVIHHRIAQLH